MHSINLDKYNLRTDLIIDNIKDEELIKSINYKKEKLNRNCLLEEVEIEDLESKKLGVKKGKYKVISFNDVTDKDNYKMLEKAFISTLKKILKECNLLNKEKVGIIGLGNKSSTPDSLGPLVIDNILVTHHIKELGLLDSSYKDVVKFAPGVKGVTGLDAKDFIKTIIKVAKLDYIIIIDALKTNNTSKLLKTIQITDTLLIPGSGVNNSRLELSKSKLDIPIICIGIPTVIDSSVIAYDTLNKVFDLLKKEKSIKDKEKVLGLLGSLSEIEIKTLIKNTKENNELIVTVKEIDFLMEKFSLLIGDSINKILHKLN